MELVKTEPSHPDKDDQEPKIPDTLPVLPLPETVVFPYMIAPLERSYVFTFGRILV